MQVKTPEQLEDAALADAIRSIIRLKTAALQREMQNNLTEQIKVKVDTARLMGKKVDVQAFIKEVVSEVADS